MRFDSAQFLLFFIPVLVLHQWLGARRLVLVLASYLFYASWNPPFVLLLLASTLLDYVVGRLLEGARSVGRRRALLACSLAGNLGVLAYFKYVDFALDALAGAGLVDAALLEPFHVRAAIPLGISFYTFQTISYSIDVYRGQTRACRSFADFALFVSFFPQLVAGPILRASEFLPQIATNRAAGARQSLEGLELCALGLFKKVVLADGYARLVDRCFAQPEGYAASALVLATFGFWVQIYCDFSGYSTMARGLAKLLGYELPQNFDYPLLAGNPIDYRRGWHMTMGNWFRDYLYRPLGGDRKGQARTALNTIVTWTAFGFWHGASWTFLAWGLYQGVLLAIYRLVKARRAGRSGSRGLRMLGFVAFPAFLALSNVLFRAQDLDTAWVMLARMARWDAGESVHVAWGLGLVALYVVHWACKLWYREDLLCRVGWLWRLAIAGATLAGLLLFAGSGEPFYYFQF